MRYVLRRFGRVAGVLRRLPVLLSRVAINDHACAACSGGSDESPEFSDICRYYILVERSCVRCVFRRFGRVARILRHLPVLLSRVAIMRALHAQAVRTSRRSSPTSASTTFSCSDQWSCVRCVLRRFGRVAGVLRHLPVLFSRVAIMRALRAQAVQTSRRSSPTSAGTTLGEWASTSAWRSLWSRCSERPSSTGSSCPTSSTTPSSSCTVRLAHRSI